MRESVRRCRAECRAVAIMSGRAIDESLDHAAVQVQSPAQKPLSSDDEVRSRAGDREGGGGCFTPPTPLACFTPLGSSLNPREAWRCKRVVRDLQAPASQRRDKVHIPWPSVGGPGGRYLEIVVAYLTAPRQSSLGKCIRIVCACRA